jgi:hypothetical protein
MTERKYGSNVLPHERVRVAWYQPDVLLTAGKQLLSSLDQLRNRDARESYDLPMTIIDRSDRVRNFGSISSPIQAMAGMRPILSRGPRCERLSIIKMSMK